MSQRERQRLMLLSRVEDGKMDLGGAAKLMEVSYRQAKRLLRRYRQKGDKGLVHGLRGKPSNNRRWGDQERKQAVELYLHRYPDFGPTLAAENMARREGLVVDHENLRRWLVTGGHWKPRRDRSREHRQWRERRHHRGEMVQMDGSDHPWFEGRAGRCVLMVLVDDATNWTWGLFAPSETTQAAMKALWSYTRQRGLPQSLYVDRDSIYVVNRPATAQENLDNTGGLTQFGRAMRELNVQIIRAHSPQAKGRVERANGTLQDRLVKTLRLEGISDIDAANEYLKETYWPGHNTRFALAPAKPLDLHRPRPSEAELDRVLCMEERRTVGNDYCVRWENRYFQLLGTDANRGLAGQSIEVRQHLDGRMELCRRGRQLQHKELTQRPARPGPAKASLPQRVAIHRGQAIPAPNHPWREPIVPPPVATAGAASAGVPRRCVRPRCARPHSTTGDTRGRIQIGDIST
jgi:hypothetical protein